MKVSPSKLIKQLLKKKVFFYPQKSLNRKKISISLFLLFLLAFFYYFLKPIYFDYNNNKDIIQNKISDKFNLKTTIVGNISYSVFPTPTISLEEVKINFGKKKLNQVFVKKLLIKTALNKIGSIDQLDFKKLLLIEQSIKINPKNVNEIFSFLTLHKKGKIELKKIKVTFEDGKKNKVNFDNVNFFEKFKGNKHQIDSNLYFSNNLIKIKFQNNISSKKFLKINIPELNQSLEINFDKESTLKNLSGQLKLSILDSILLINFKGKDNFEIFKSYIRNKFLNSKIDGRITFVDPFSFNINLDVNQISIKKLLKFYPIFQKRISKKINGQLNIKIKSVETLVGKIRDVNMQLNFQNGDLRVRNIKSKLPHSTTLDSNIILLLNSKKPKIEYNIKFSSQNAKKFLRKLGIYDFESKKVNLYSEGTIDLNSKKIRLAKLLIDQIQEKNKNQIKIIEDSFNQIVIGDDITGLFDLFKFKKFLKEVN